MRRKGDEVPFGIGCLSGLLILGGGFLGLGSIWLLLTKGGIEAAALQGIGPGAIAVVAGVGLFNVVLGFSLCDFKRWAWLTYVVIQALGLSAAGWGLLHFQLVELLPLLVHIWILSYVCHPKIRALYFKRSSLNQSNP